MTLSLPALALEAIRLGEKATVGPWRTYPIHGEEYGEVFGAKGVDADARITLHSAADASFIAFARTALPQLAQAYLELEAKLKVAREALKQIASCSSLEYVGIADKALAELGEGKG